MQFSSTPANTAQTNQSETPFWIYVGSAVVRVLDTGSAAALQVFRAGQAYQLGEIIHTAGTGFLERTVPANSLYAREMRRRREEADRFVIELLGPPPGFLEGISFDPNGGELQDQGQPNNIAMPPVWGKDP